MVDILTEDETLPLILIEDARDDRNQCGLPTARRSDEHQQFAGVDLQINAP
jgi:hypothetical protein